MKYKYKIGQQCLVSKDICGGFKVNSIVTIEKYDIYNTNRKTYIVTSIRNNMVDIFKELITEDNKYETVTMYHSEASLQRVVFIDIINRIPTEKELNGI